MNPKKTASFVEEKMYLFASQWTRSQINENDGKNQWMTLWIASLRTLFSRYGPRRLPYIPKLKEITSGTEIFIKCRGQMGNRWLFWRRWQIVLKETYRNVKRLLDQVYRGEMRLCWRINRIFAKKVVFSLSSYGLIKLLSIVVNENLIRIIG